MTKKEKVIVEVLAWVCSFVILIAIGLIMNYILVWISYEFLRSRAIWLWNYLIKKL